MRTRLLKHGDCFAVRIPSSFVEQAGLGKSFHILVENDEIVLRRYKNHRSMTSVCSRPAIRDTRRAARWATSRTGSAVGCRPWSPAPCGSRRCGAPASTRPINASTDRSRCRPSRARTRRPCRSGSCRRRARPRPAPARRRHDRSCTATAHRRWDPTAGSDPSGRGCARTRPSPRWVIVRQPLTDPARMPRTKNRWRRRTRPAGRPPGGTRRR